MNIDRARERIERFNGDLDRITAESGGFLRCETCGRTGAVLSDYWRKGWPKCHGATMRWWTQRQVAAGEVPDLEATR